MIGGGPQQGIAVDAQGLPCGVHEAVPGRLGRTGCLRA